MTLLRYALAANSAFSLTSGATLLLGAGVLAPWLGEISVPVLRCIGGGLIAFSYLVARQAARVEPSRREVTQICLGDLAWVLGSFSLVILKPIELTPAGQWAIASVADIVLIFGVLQLVGLKRVNRLAGIEG